MKHGSSGSLGGNYISQRIECRPDFKFLLSCKKSGNRSLTLCHYDSEFKFTMFCASLYAFWYLHVRPLAPVSSGAAHRLLLWRVPSYSAGRTQSCACFLNTGVIVHSSVVFNFFAGEGSFRRVAFLFCFAATPLERIFERDLGLPVFKCVYCVSKRWYRAVVRPLEAVVPSTKS